MLLEAAYAFCVAAHAGQTRKFSGIPYHSHPIAVSDLVITRLGGNDTLAAAALLHDVLEDCPNITEYLMRQLFPEQVVDIVVELTKVPGVDYEAQLLEASEEAQLIKLMDILHNCSDCPDPNYKAKKVDSIRNSLTKLPMNLRMEIINLIA